MATLAAFNVDASPSPNDGGYLVDSTPANDEAAASNVPQLHLYAQQGDLVQMRQLLDSKVTDANEADSEGVTALHWAALSGHTNVCQYLLENGAEIDAMGGPLKASPIHWAARNGNLHIVALLIQHGADASVVDAQSFNTLHLAVHSHNPMLIAYLLSQQLPITIDSEDSAGQTALQWACYQGDQISVALLLKAGADPNKADTAGLTAVHWSVVKGSVPCISKVVEAGGDASKKNNQDLSPIDLARKQRSVTAWMKAMEQIGREPDGKFKRKTLSDRQTKIAIFTMPFLASFLILKTLEILPWHTGIVLAAAEGFGMHHVIVKVLVDGKASLGGTKDGDALQKSPYLCALLAASIFWVTNDWLLTVVANTTAYAYTNMLYAASALLSAYNLFRAVTLDPGYIVRPSSESELREGVDDLVKHGRMNGQNFCLTCMARQPLRSRHCRHCNRCVARFDH